MSQPKDPRNPSWTKLGNPQAPGAEQRPTQNKSKPAASQKNLNAPKGKGLGGAQNRKAPQDKK